MPEIRAFRGLRFDPQNVSSFDDVITPPFDVISPAQRAELAARSPSNMVHLILPEPAQGLDKYANAGSLLDAWIDEGVLTRDTEPSFYVLEQRFTGLDGEVHTRRAFFGLTRIPESGERTILGHEKTFDHKIEDRLALMRATRANFGAILVMYSDPENRLNTFLDQVRSSPPDVTANTVDQTHQRLWRVAPSPAVSEFFRDRRIYIADGHHRYATAVAYRDEMRRRKNSDGPQPYDHVLMGFVAAEDPGLFVYPAHRVLDPPNGHTMDYLSEKLAPWFDCSPVEGNLAGRVAAAEGCALGVAAKSGEQCLFQLRAVDREALLGNDHGPAWRDLDVAVLHRAVLENALGVDAAAELIYEPDPDRALEYTRRGEKKMAFLLKGATPNQIFACADAGEEMPQKATYLFPKLPTGMVFYRHG